VSKAEKATSPPSEENPMTSSSTQKSTAFSLKKHRKQLAVGARSSRWPRRDIFDAAQDSGR
jgi:hypothetical protein